MQAAERVFPVVAGEVTVEGGVQEGAGGEEKRNNTAEQLASLPFTRNAIGSMDFTPGAFHCPGRPNVASDAGELGLTVLYESGIQNLSGTPESYEARPEARRYLEQLPRRWEETRAAPPYWPDGRRTGVGSSAGRSRARRERRTCRCASAPAAGWWRR